MNFEKLINDLVVSNFFSGSQWHPEQEELDEIFMAS